MNHITTRGAVSKSEKSGRIWNCLGTKLRQTWCAGMPLRSLLGLVSLIVLMPAPALAVLVVTPSNTWSGLVNILVSLMNKGIGTLVFLAVAVYFWGITSNILEFGEDKGGEKKKAYLFWGIIILFVMVSIFGILRLVQNTLFDGEAIPTSGPGYEARCPGGKC